MYEDYLLKNLQKSCPVRQSKVVNINIGCIIHIFAYHLSCHTCIHKCRLYIHECVQGIKAMCLTSEKCVNVRMIQPMPKDKIFSISAPNEIFEIDYSLKTYYGRQIFIFQLYMKNFTLLIL
jgi:hypothetical protein